MNQRARNPSPLKIIWRDLKHFKWLWILAVACLMTALAVVVVTQNTRMLIVQRSELGEQRDSLNNDWRHLLIEENALDEHNRIEQLAQQRLQMVRPQPDDEVLVTP
ncbi:cell division protein FtsL [Celerinatantimonas sp. YJH-8]|uniref:cell division protein FtsL n=1 Tax=Celerinatantimonas sp. YJH-8 TaxID=3228714 RepID=UPI0038C76230